MSDETIIDISALWDGEMASVQACGKQVLIANIGGNIFACEDRCPHLGVPLSKGRLEGAKVTCTAHLWQLDLATGCGINPAAARLKVFHIRQVGEGKVAVSEALRPIDHDGGYRA